MTFRTCPRSLLLALFAGAWSVTACADFTLSGRSTLSTMNLPNTGKEALYVRKGYLRRDITDRGRTYSYLYDLRRRELTVVDHFRRLAEVHPLAATTAKKKARVQDLKLSMTPTGRAHALVDWNCEEHDMEAATPAEIGDEKVTLQIAGKVWLARKIPQHREIEPFIKAVQADDFFLGASTPGQATSSQARGINETLREVLERGMLCAADIQLRYEGSGPLADLGRRMATRLNVVYENLSDAPLADATFDVPAGYQVTRR